ncbi:ImmA/IrrE family metallo-endopeptidase [Alteromonas sp. 345S023]|uniref:ImmA/IrrE family metallo-endopeptidase n=1 Tax=Alteromonas profundi TaxID=2696062 RepID=A0A7X5LPC9_9ALTE|nr:ImmA/IrrE family metallo-endopeptidase [Alteromonas profundi]NDV93081.1 ImmA/IrrE family metallo-endopeptidase [Alteromonas profundi]
MTYKRKLGFEVPPLSQKDIANKSLNLRKSLDEHAILSFSEKRVEMARVLERMEHHELITMQIVPNSILSGVEADCRGTHIRISESVYDNAVTGCPRSQFTLAHELGHAALHCSVEPVSFGFNRNTSHAIYRDSEWQADSFASCFIVPFTLLGKDTTAARIQSEFGLSMTASILRMKMYKLERQRAI